MEIIKVSDETLEKESVFKEITQVEKVFTISELDRNIEASENHVRRMQEEIALLKEKRTQALLIK